MLILNFRAYPFYKTQNGCLTKNVIKFDWFLTIGIQAKSIFCGARLKKSLQPLKIPVKICQDNPHANLSCSFTVLIIVNTQISTYS